MSPCREPDRRRLLAGLLGALVAAPACARAPHVVLDRRTGTTLQLTGEPWVLALDQPDLAAHARDYVALHAVEVSNAGARRHYLAAFLWSTVPGRNRFAGDAPVLRLLVDDRDLTLRPAAASLRDAGISDWPLKPPGRDALLVLYEAQPTLLRQLGATDRVRLRPLTDSSLPEEVWFVPWRDGRVAFRRFAAEVLGLR